MLRIDVHHGDSQTVRVALTGDLCADRITELRSVIGEVSRSAERVALDLSGLRRVDLEGVRFLVANGTRATILVGCPAYVREWMRCEATR
jgi:ABC-type transporter Mla MlaB component